MCQRGPEFPAETVAALRKFSSYLLNSIYYAIIRDKKINID